MKKQLLTIVMFCSAFAALPVLAQIPEHGGGESHAEFRPDTVLRRPVETGFTLPDSLSHMTPWRPEYRNDTRRAKPQVSMTSVVVIQRENLPSRVTVIDNNTLRLGPRFTLSNGQAWNWSPFPDAYLDARTLSFPTR